jgi:hypothetical protein
MTESQDEETSTHRERRVRRAAGLLVGGAVVATSALALPALATTEDPAPAASEPARPPELFRPSLVNAVAATTSTTVAPPPSPLEEFAAKWDAGTPEDRFRLRFFISSDEERLAILTWLFPPPPPPPPPPPAPVAPAAKPVPRAAPAPRPQPAPQASQSAPGGYLACVRQHESGGRYNINTGNGYYGAYQFLPGTWNSAARNAGRSDLVGVLPSNASPSDQDAVAQALYASQGRQPWAGNGC